MTATASNTRIQAARRARVAAWIVLLALGAIQAWAGRFRINADAVSYLDIGDSYFRGEWRTAINGYWSPLYSWLLGLANAVVRPSGYWEFPLAHLVNFVIYLAALFAFDRLLGQLMDHQRRNGAEGAGVWPEWVSIVFGFALFGWSSLVLIAPEVLLTPDMLVAAVAYLAGATLLRLAAEPSAAKRSTLVWLGVTLGVGYLAKAAMFPLAFVFLLVAALLPGVAQRRAASVSVAFLAFVLAASPFIIGLSVSKGRATFGDVGKISYAWYVNAFDLAPDQLQVFRRHWAGDPPGSGTPRHPARRIADSPPIYEFGTPVGGTYPVWYDPSYWYEGLEVHVRPREQLAVLRSHAYWYYVQFVGLPVGRLLRTGLSRDLLAKVKPVPLVLLVGWLLLAFYSRRKRALVGDALRYWYLIAPGLAACAMYALVHVEERFVAPFAVLIYLGAFAGLRMPATETRSTATILSMFVAAVSAAFLASFALGAVPRSTPLDWRVAEGLARLDPRPHRKVASLQYANPAHRGWARLARARIVAEIFPDGEDRFWAAPDSVQARVLRTFIGAGADVVVAANPPVGVRPAGWQPIGETGYLAYVLR